MSQLNNRLSSDERRKAILAVASELFFELGYAATSIDAIIDKVGGSKRSIYTEFGNKEGLFKALVNDCASEMMAAMSIPASEEQKLEPLMRQLGLRLLELYSRPQMLVMYRTALQESQRFPELGQLFFEQGQNGQCNSWRSCWRRLPNVENSGRLTVIWLRNILLVLCATIFISKWLWD